MSQKDDAEALLKELHSLTDGLKVDAVQACLAKLDTLLAASQASPPEGRADGSISPAKWTALTSCSMAHKRLVGCLSVLK